MDDHNTQTRGWKSMSAEPAPVSDCIFEIEKLRKKYGDVVFEASIEQISQ